ncbi:uncharacterized protein [Temnothorax nylanderi]|uniref:uncharacterized protein n=1 Tax=Temnothorax nylanderi TaxID=102681 RepID=UPI003A8BCF72
MNSFKRIVSLPIRRRRKSKRDIGPRQRRRIQAELRQVKDIYCRNDQCVSTSNFITSVSNGAALTSTQSSASVIPSSVQCNFPESHLESSNVSSEESLFESLTDNYFCDDSDDGIHTSSEELGEEFRDVHEHLSVGVDLFKDCLIALLMDNNMSHVQGNNILALLRSHQCFSYLPKDVRTLLRTPKTPVELFDVEPGEYLHLGFESALINSLQSTSPSLIPRSLQVDFSTDGATLDNSGNIVLWPIQCRIANIPNAKPEVVGIYRGSRKPSSASQFFSRFVVDINSVIDNGGILYQDTKFPVTLRCFVADAPARAFILNHKSHMAANPCSKCTVTGQYFDGRMVYISLDNTPRTDENYMLQIDEEHHKGPSPLSDLPFGMVSQVPFESMHLLFIGIMKKCFEAWIDGKFSKLSKLAGHSLQTVSSRLETLKQYCPRDFARPPRGLGAYKRFKATENRQFLLYTGVVVLYGILDEDVYLHFVLLHAAIRSLACERSPNFHFADLALRTYVEKCEAIYGLTFFSYNIHGLLHVVEDVKRFGPLDAYSAFPYENNMSIFRKYCRKPDLPLQQIANRRAEQSNKCNNRFVNNCLPAVVDNPSIEMLGRHAAGPLPRELFHRSCQQFQRAKIGRWLFTRQIRDNCCILRDATICVIENFLTIETINYLLVRKFLHVQDFYDVGVPSSSVGVYKCSTLINETCIILFEEVSAKCYRMPFWRFSDCNSSDESDNDDECNQYICAVLL